MNGESFAVALERIRDDHGLSQSRLAARAGYDHSYVSRLESDSRSPTRDAVIALGSAMFCSEVELDELLMAAGFAPLDPANLLAGEPALGEAYELLSGAELPADVKDDLRAGVRMSVRQARRAGSSWKAAVDG